MTRVGIGIDFGTTNSAAAVYDGERVTLIGLEAGVDIMPSATYIDRALKTLTGQDAIDQYIADNTGRTVELIPEVIGETSVMVGNPDPEGRRPVETLTKRVYGQPVKDCGLKGRLFRGTKRLLGKKDVRRLMVFDHPFRLVALITPVLLRIRKTIAAVTAEAQHAYLGHPVNFEGRDEHRNKLALARLGEAYRHAGVKAGRFYPEPIAAAVSYLSENPAAAGERVLCVDFGGGTLDFCLLEHRRQGAGAVACDGAGCDAVGFGVVATHGIALGGDHIDQRLFQTLLFPELGKGETWRRRGIDREIIETRFPFEDYEDMLLNWAVTYMLNQNRYTTPVMDCIDQGGPAALKFERLRDLAQQNLSYQVFQEIKDFKARLSYADEAVLDIPEIDVEIRLDRPQFERIIGDLLDRVRAGIEETLRRAALGPADVSLVLGTGGSSLIPAVRRILADYFGGNVVDHDPFTSVAAGLAIADYHGY